MDEEQTYEQLSDLLGDLAQELAQQGQQLRGLMEVVEDHATELDALNGHVFDVTAGSPPSSDAAPLLPWSRNPERTPEDWDALIGWVDMICGAHAVTVIPPCWLAHEGLVLELEALRCAWAAAMAKHERKASQELASWYAYLWNPFIGRCSEVDRCRNGHQADPPATCTDLGFRPPTSAEEA